MSRVTLSNDRRTIRIIDLNIDDSRAYRVLGNEGIDKVEQKLRDAISIGVLALDRTSATAESDWVIQRLEGQIASVNLMLERRAEEMMNAVRGQFDSTRAGSIISPVAELIQRTQAELSAKLVETATAIHEAHRKLEDSIDPKRDGTILQSFLSRFEALSEQLTSSPALQAKFDELRDEIKTMITTMRIGSEANRAIEEVKGEMINASPQKGLKFEDEVKERLQRIAEIRNDVVESVGTQPGKGTCKKGDLIYHIDRIHSRVVLELKDHSSSKFTYDKVQALMEDCLGNRDALFGIFLVKDPTCLPDGVGCFHITDQFLIATAEYVEIAIKIAIIMAHQKIARMSQASGLDLASIESNAQEIKETIGDLSNLESGCATAQKALTKTADGIRRVSRTLLEKTERLLGQIANSHGEQNG